MSVSMYNTLVQYCTVQWDVVLSLIAQHKMEDGNGPSVMKSERLGRFEDVFDDGVVC